MNGIFESLFFVEVSGLVRYYFTFNFGVSKRLPRYYDGTMPTTRHIRQLLPRFLEEIGRKLDERPDLVLAAWPELIGPQLAPMTQAVSFVNGVLTVKVKNSTLHSLLSQNEKARLIQTLRSKFPSVTIKTLLFRLG